MMVVIINNTFEIEKEIIDEPVELIPSFSLTVLTSGVSLCVGCEKVVFFLRGED